MTPDETPTLRGRHQRARALIYLVDDDRNVLRSLRVVLARFYDVEVSEDAESAVAGIAAKKPDVVVVDVKMPGHDGLWVFREVRKFNQEVPIILNSAYQDFLAPDDLRGAFAPFATLNKTGSYVEFRDIIAEAARKVGFTG